MAAVDIGVGHDDDLAVPELGDVEVLADAAAEGGDECADLLEAEHLVDAGLLDIEDLALEGEDGLGLDIASLGGAAAGGVTLDQVELGALEVLGLAVPELVWHGAGFEGGLAACELAGLAGGLAGLRGEHALQAEPLGLAGVFLHPDLERLGDGRADEALDLGVEQLLLGLVVEGGLGQLGADDGDEPLAEVLAAGRGVLLLDEPGLAGVAVERAREGDLEALPVRPAVDIVDVVGEGEQCLVVPVVVLERDLADHAPLGVLPAEVDRRADGVLALHQVLDILDEPVDRAEGGLLGLAVGADAFVGELDGDARVEVGELAQAGRERLEAKVGLGEDVRVGLEADLGAAFAAAAGGDLADDMEGLDHQAAGELDAVDLAVAPDLALEPLAEGVDAGDADAVQAAGDLVGAALLLELAPGVQLGHDDLDRRLAVEVGVLVAHGLDGDAASVVDDGARPVGLDGDADGGGEAGHRLVDRVVDGLVHQVVQGVDPRAADVHAGAFADRLEALEDFDLVGAVGAIAVDHGEFLRGWMEAKPRARGPRANLEIRPSNCRSVGGGSRDSAGSIRGLHRRAIRRLTVVRGAGARARGGTLPAPRRHPRGLEQTAGGQAA